MSNSITYIDLFAGIGGFHQAMNFFEGQCVFACEWDKHAATTYKKNYNILPAGDITKISEVDIPSHELLCAGFPCQAFSVSGKQKGFEDTRGTLFFDIARIANHHQPKVLLLENVRNFARHDGGRTLKTVIKTLNNIGYDCHHKILNASDFGLPQNRERLFIVAFRKDLAIKTFHFPTPLQNKVSLNSILEKKPQEAKIINRPDTVFTKEYSPETDIFGNLNLPHRPIQIGHVNKGGQGERIYSPYGHAITLSAYGGGAGAKTGLYYIDKQVRKLSPRECARLQGFPDDFQIVSSLTQSYQQFGNSVAVNVLKAIIKEIINTGCFINHKKNQCA